MNLVNFRICLVNTLNSLNTINSLNSLHGISINLSPTVSFSRKFFVYLHDKHY